MDDYEIRKYDPQFKQQLLDLQSHHWRHDHARRAAYFEWKYERNPYMETPSIVVALKEQQVVGMLGMYGAKWEFGKDRQYTLCPCPADVVVEPSHRRRGLFKRMMIVLFEELVSRGYRHTFALSAGTNSSPGLLSIDWRIIGPAETMRRRHHRARFREYLRRAGASLGVSEPRKHAFSLLDQNIAKGGILIRSMARPAQMEQLIHRLDYDGRIRHVRDADYFGWRFQNPFSDYRFLFSGEDSLEGYLVLQASYDADRLSATIVDWEASTFEIRMKLLQTAVECGRFENLFTWSVMLPDDLKALLRKLGFKPVGEKGGKRDRPVLVRPLQNAKQEENWWLGGYSLIEPASWDLRWLYSDHCS